jgi:hypothetical protein
MKKYILLLVLFCQLSILRAIPTDWTVNSFDYQYSLTITGTVVLNGETLGSAGDAVAAFINNQCRGVAQASYVAANNSYYFYVSVFSSTYSGEPITFRFYNQAEDSIYSGFQALTFADGANYGSVSEPYVFTNGSVNFNTTISIDTLLENLEAPKFIGKLTGMKNDVVQNYQFQLLNQLSFFELKHDSLFSKISFNYEIKPEYVIQIATYNSDSSEYFTDSVCVKIIDVFEPVEVILSNNTLLENTPNLAIIGVFQVFQPSNNGSYVLKIDSVLDYLHFVLVGDSLVAQTIFNYETQKYYQLQMLLIESGGDTIKQAFSIEILDANDAPYGISISNDTISENQTIGTFIGRLTAIDEDAADVLSFELNTAKATQYFQLLGDSLVTLTVLDFESTPFCQVSATVTDLAGAKAETTLTINVNDVLETGINNKIYALTIKCYPNPATDVLFIESAHVISLVRIYNMQGQLQSQFEGGAISSINVSNLKTGTYIIESIGSQTKQYGRFIKE